MDGDGPAARPLFACTCHCRQRVEALRDKVHDMASRDLVGGEARDCRGLLIISRHRVILIVHRFLYTRACAGTHRSSTPWSTLYSRWWSQDRNRCSTRWPG